MDWQHYLREAIETYGGNHTKIARKAGIPTSRIADWMRTVPAGQPPIEDAIALAKAMRLSLDEVFRGIPPDDDLAESVRQLVAAAREQGRREALEHIEAKEGAIAGARFNDRATAQARKRIPLARTPKARRSER